MAAAWVASGERWRPQALTGYGEAVVRLGSPAETTASDWCRAPSKLPTPSPRWECARCGERAVATGGYSPAMPEPSPGAFAAAVPLPGVDPRVALASTLHASATTAALLGSGVSRAAGIRTGWDVALDLVRRYAKASGVQGELEDPEAWWRQSQGSP